MSDETSYDTTSYDTSYTSSYDTSSYDTSSYDTSYTSSYDTSYTSSYDTSYTSSYDTTSYDTTTSYTEPTWDTSWSGADAWNQQYVDAGWTETGSSTYDSTDWSQVADVSQGYLDVHQSADGLSWDLWNASTDAWLQGDTTLAYDLQQSSIDMGAYADQAWDTSNSVWTSMAETTTVTSWDTSGSYDTSWSASTTDAAVDSGW